MLGSRKNDLFVLYTHSKVTYCYFNYIWGAGGKTATLLKCLLSQFIQCQAGNYAISALTGESALEDTVVILPVSEVTPLLSLTTSQIQQMSVFRGDFSHVVNTLEIPSLFLCVIPIRIWNLHLGCIYSTFDTALFFSFGSVRLRKL